MTSGTPPCAAPATPARASGRPITPEILDALQKKLGSSWIVGTGTYPEGRRITATPWPPTWAPVGRIVIGRSASDVLAQVKQRRKEATDGS